MSRLICRLVLVVNISLIFIFWGVVAAALCDLVHCVEAIHDIC